MRVDDEQWDILVIGGGPAGMTAAGRAAELGARVILLEQNDILGKKLIITGGGRCNVTNEINDRHILVERYGERGKYLHALFSRFSPADMRAFLRRFGVETKVEAEGRVFPVSDNARSVRGALEAYMREGNVTIRTGRRITGFRISHQEPQRITGVTTHRGEIITARSYILATGGVSRQDTGSTGDGLSWLQQLNLPVRDSDTSLVPVRIRDTWIRALQGVSLPDAALHLEKLPEHSTPKNIYDERIWANGKRVWSRRGKLLFTHFGISGPLALNSAEMIRDMHALDSGRVRLLIDIAPAFTQQELEQKITAAAQQNGKRQIRSLLHEFLPQRVTSVLCDHAETDPATPLAVVSKAQRKRIVTLLRGAPCTFLGLLGSEHAVVSSGGLDPDALDFRTMRLHNFPELAVLGDILDFNRQSGGFSLQVCWASGWVAGTALAKEAIGN